MDNCYWLTLAVFTIGLVALVGFFITKSKGFGRYATSTFLLILVLVLASLFYSSGKLEGQVISNILFAVVGFAGGLFTSKDSCAPKDSNNQNQANGAAPTRPRSAASDLVP